MTIWVDEIGGDGCVLCLSFNEDSGTTVYDRSGYSNNGTIYGATWTSGVTGSALSFDGVDDYVEVPDSPSLDITGEITVIAWVYPLEKNVVTIVSKRGVSTGTVRTGYGLTIETDNKYAFIVGIDNYWDFVKTTEEYEPYVWEQIAAVHDGSELKIYRNGEFDNSASATQFPFNSNNSPLRLGKKLAYYFNGIIDSVRIYNRALSREEIQAHFRGARLLPLRGD